MADFGIGPVELKAVMLNFSLTDKIAIRSSSIGRSKSITKSRTRFDPSIFTKGRSAFGLLKKADSGRSMSPNESPLYTSIATKASSVSVLFPASLVNAQLATLPGLSVFGYLGGSNGVKSGSSRIS
ncbi:MAG: hypothetical protein HQ518_28440 [Rhodopirellula sp.]|nr:hypothetical protein [Rhodopirellula sp.]